MQYTINRKGLLRAKARRRGANFFWVAAQYFGWRPLSSESVTSRKSCEEPISDALL